MCPYEGESYTESGENIVECVVMPLEVAGWVQAFILYPWGDPRVVEGVGAEFCAVDLEGNIYAGEPRARRLQKYVRVRP